MTAKEETNTEENPSEQLTQEDTEESKEETQQENTQQTEKALPTSAHASARALPETQRPEVSQAEIEQFIVGRLLLGDTQRQVAALSGGTIGKSTIAKYYPKDKVDGLRRYILQRIRQGATDEAISNEAQILPETIQKLRVKLQPKSFQGPLGPQQPRDEIDMGRLPQGSVVLDQKMIQNIRAGLSPAQTKLFDSALMIASQQNYHNPNPSGSYPSSVKSPNEMVDYELAQLLRAKRISQLSGLDQNPQQFGFKEALDLAKFITDQRQGNGKQGVSPKDFFDTWQTGFQAHADVDRKYGQGGPKSMVDLKIEEMRESHDLDVEKIRWEQKKFLLTAENDKEKWSRLQETFGPMIQMAAPEVRNAIRELGKSVGRSLGNPKSNHSVEAETEKFECPRCHAALKVPVPQDMPENTSEIKIKCPKCGEITNVPVEKDVQVEQTELRPKSERLSSRYT